MTTVTEAAAPATTTAAAAAKAKRVKAPAYRVTSLSEWDRFRKDMEAAQRRIVEAEAKYREAVKELTTAKAGLAVLDARRPWK